MFLMDIADHAGPIQSTWRQRWKKFKNQTKTKPKLTHKTDIKVRARISFLVPSYIYIWYCLNLCHFGTFFMQCAQQPSGSLSCGFYVALNMYDLLALNMYDLLGDIYVIKKASVSIYILTQPWLWSDSPFDFRNWVLLVFSIIVLCRITKLPKK